MRESKGISWENNHSLFSQVKGKIYEDAAFMISQHEGIDPV